jgi:hypothetical protein
MRLALAIVAVLAGCAGDDDPHELGACDPAWTPEGMTLEQAGITQCELACESEPDNADGPGMDMPCSATYRETPDGPVLAGNCPRTFAFGDQRGCCGLARPSIVFAVCD